ncbi:hypothetical protein [Nonomuraea sp. NPDC046570]|uniref:WXG100 family type VII secretion target n=1 Tax=Nonomuraea sp. NPDC046570 TaxID=3155255 RepID=UPI0033F39789
MEILTWRHAFMLAASTVSGSALILRAAGPLALLFWSMVADPEQMRAAAGKWGNAHPAGLTDKQQPGDALPTGDDIEFLRAELGKLLKDAQTNKVWEGQAFESFKTLVTEFDGQLLRLKDLRNGVKGSLESAASLFQSAAMVCLAISAFVYGLAQYVTLARFNPSTALTAEGQATIVVGRLYKAAKSIVDVVIKVKFRIMLILAGITYAAGAVNDKFPGMQPITGKAPKFTPANAVFDPTKLRVTKPPESGVPDMDDLPKQGGLGGLIEKII